MGAKLLQMTMQARTEKALIIIQVGESLTFMLDLIQTNLK